MSPKWVRFMVATFLACMVAIRPSATSILAADDEGRVHALALSKAFRRAAETAMPSVVTVVSKAEPKLSDAEKRRLREAQRARGPFGLPGDDDENNPLWDLTQNVGSGVVIDRGGIVLTNSHVVAEADQVIVRLQDGTEIKAKEVKNDPDSDIAVLQLTPSSLPNDFPIARLGDSDILDIGDWVIAIGNPFELEATVSAGIISGKGRAIEKIKRGKLLQTDAAINPGNSGGPLVNLDGEVIGINTAIATSSGGYQGIGFAIPISRAKWVIDELIRNGKVRRAWLGISIDEVTPELSKLLGVPARSGARVREVVRNGPAEAAGIRIDDIITNLANDRVRDPGDLRESVERKQIGSTQNVTVIRKGKSISLQVIMQTLPDLPSKPLKDE